MSVPSLGNECTSAAADGEIAAEAAADIKTPVIDGTLLYKPGEQGDYVRKKCMEACEKYNLRGIDSGDIISFRWRNRKRYGKVWSYAFENEVWAINVVMLSPTNAYKNEATGQRYVWSFRRCESIPLSEMELLTSEEGLGQNYYAAICNMGFEILDLGTDEFLKKDVDIPAGIVSEMIKDKLREQREGSRGSESSSGNNSSSGDNSGCSSDCGGSDCGSSDCGSSDCGGSDCGSNSGDHVDAEN
jgi:uncharacterized membrane protein YgcG